MSYLSIILLGILQAITEFVPVSSSGHLSLIQNIFHIDSADFFFDAILHLGTLLAILVFYRKDVRSLIAGLFRLSDSKSTARSGSTAEGQKQLALRIILGSLPLIVVCFFLGTINTLSKISIFVSVMLLVNGFILHFTEHYGFGHKQESELTIWDTLLIGLGQAVAVIPGISRTGVTMSLGMVRGMSKSQAMRFSFLLSIPAVLFSAVLSLVHAFRSGIDTSLLPAYLIALVLSAVIGMFTIRFLNRLVHQNSWHVLSYYCWGAGIVALFLSLIS